jgi:hypothetical protein
MCDVERWFNELTHRYLEIIRIVHLRCWDHWPLVKVAVTAYRAIKRHPNPFLNKHQLWLFSTMLDTLEAFIRQHLDEEEGKKITE